MKKKIGLISGNGEFPLIFVKKAKENGYFVSVCAFKGETDPIIEDYADDITWVHLGQIKKIISCFTKKGVNQAVMLGGVKKTRIFIDVRPDSLAIKALARMKSTNDDHLLRTFADIMKEKGVEILASSDLMPEFLAKKGIWTKKKPSKILLKDIFLGFKTAKKIGEMDIGQTVVVAGGSIVAVEAVEGTDEAIKRGGLLSAGDGVVVKVSKPNQDMRFDIPAIGPETINSMKSSGIFVLAVEAGRTNVLDHDKMIKMADENKIIIVAVDTEFFREMGLE